jgi:hypothetical protein
MKKRNKINTGKSKIGAFTRAAKKAGMSEQEFAKKVLANKHDYSPAIIKKANFTITATKWEKKIGGPVKYQKGKLINVPSGSFSKSEDQNLPIPSWVNWGVPSKPGNYKRNFPDKSGYLLPSISDLTLDPNWKNNLIPSITQRQKSVHPKLKGRANPSKLANLQLKPKKSLPGKFNPKFKLNTPEDKINHPIWGKYKKVSKPSGFNASFSYDPNDALSITGKIDPNLKNKEINPNIQLKGKYKNILDVGYDTDFENSNLNLGLNNKYVSARFNTDFEGANKLALKTKYKELFGADFDTNFKENYNIGVKAGPFSGRFSNTDNIKNLDLSLKHKNIDLKGSSDLQGKEKFNITGKKEIGPVKVAANYNINRDKDKLYHNLGIEGDIKFSPKFSLSPSLVSDITNQKNKLGLSAKISPNKNIILTPKISWSPDQYSVGTGINWKPNKMLNIGADVNYSNEGFGGNVSLKTALNNTKKELPKHQDGKNIGGVERYNSILNKFDNKEWSSLSKDEQQFYKDNYKTIIPNKFTLDENNTLYGTLPTVSVTAPHYKGKGEDITRKGVLNDLGTVGTQLAKDVYEFTGIPAAKRIYNDFWSYPKAIKGFGKAVVNRATSPLPYHVPTPEEMVAGDKMGDILEVAPGVGLFGKGVKTASKALTKNPLKNVDNYNPVIKSASNILDRSTINLDRVRRKKIKKKREIDKSKIIKDEIIEDEKYDIIKTSQGKSPSKIVVKDRTPNSRNKHTAIYHPDTDTWQLRASWENGSSMDAGRAYNALNKQLPPLVKILEKGNLSLDSYKNITGMGKRTKDWDVIPKGYIPLNYQSVNNKMLDDLRDLTKLDPGEVPWTRGIADKNNLQEAVNRINKHFNFPDKRRARISQSGTIELPNYQLNRKYKQGGLVKYQDGKPISYKDPNLLSKLMSLKKKDAIQSPSRESTVDYRDLNLAQKLEDFKEISAQNKKEQAVLRAQLKREDDIRNRKFINKAISYKDDPDFFDRSAVLPGSNGKIKYSDYVKKKVYEGTHAYNPSTGALTKLQIPVSVDPLNKSYNKRKEDRTTEEDEAFKYQHRRNVAFEDLKSLYKNPVFLAPGMAASAITTGPIIAGNRILSGLATAGGFANAGFNSVPDTYKAATDGRYLDAAGNAGLVALDLLPAANIGYRYNKNLNLAKKDFSEFYKKLKSTPIKYEPLRTKKMNHETGKWEEWEMPVSTGAVRPTREYSDVVHKFPNLTKDLNIPKFQHVMDVAYPGRAGSGVGLMSNKKGSLMYEPTSGELFDSNTRYWLNKLYGHTPRSVKGLTNQRAASQVEHYGKKIKDLPNYQTGKYIPVDYSSFGSIDSPVSESTSTVAPILTNAQKKAVALQDMWNALTDKEKEKVTAINHFKQRTSQFPRTKDAPITVEQSIATKKLLDEAGTENTYTVPIKEKIAKVEADRARLNEVGRVALLNNENKGRNSIGQEKTAWNTAMAGIQAGPGMVYSVGLQGIKGLTGSDGGADWSKIQPDFYGIRNNPAYEGQDYSLSKAINDKWAKDNPGFAGLIDIGVPLVGGFGWNKAAKLVDNTLDFANSAKGGLGAMPGTFTRSSNSPGNVIVANQLNRNLSNADIIKRTAVADLGKDEKLFYKTIEKMGMGADDLDDFIKQRISDLESKEGFKRLVDQERSYLSGVTRRGSGEFRDRAAPAGNLTKEELETLAEKSAKARIEELKQMHFSKESGAKNPSYNRIAEILFRDKENFDQKTFDKFFGEQSPVYQQNKSGHFANNAFYQAGPTFFAKSEDAIPGRFAIGPNLIDDIGTRGHEVAHALQRVRVLPVDDLLRKGIKPKKSLPRNPTAFDNANAGLQKNAKDYSYFKTGSGGKEPTAFAQELIEVLIKEGFIKHRYDNITPELLESAYKSLLTTKDPSIIRNKRIFDFMEPSSDNFETLSKVLNRLPLTIPAIGTAGLLNQQQYKKGGQVKKDLKGTYTSSAQRLMDDNDLDPSYITASNENGRIYKRDVNKALKSLNNYGAGFPNALDYKKVGVLPKNKIKYSKNTLIGPIGMPPYKWKSYKTPIFNHGGQIGNTIPCKGSKVSMKMLDENDVLHPADSDNLSYRDRPVGFSMSISKSMNSKYILPKHQNGSYTWDSNTNTNNVISTINPGTNIIIPNNPIENQINLETQAKNTLNDIYTSVGFNEKLKEEYNATVKTNPKYKNLYPTFDHLLNDRLKSFKNTNINWGEDIPQEKRNYSVFGSGVRMGEFIPHGDRRIRLSPNYTANSSSDFNLAPLGSDINTIIDNKDNKYTDQIDFNLHIDKLKQQLKNTVKGSAAYYTLLEELDHASQFPMNSNYYASEYNKPEFINSSESNYWKKYDNRLDNGSKWNITPNALQTLSKNIDSNDKRQYETNPTEILAKKRLAEVFLINNGQLEPGGQITDKHVDYLYKAYKDKKLPSGVFSFLSIFDESPYINKLGTNSKIFKTRVKNVMNKIAMNNNNNLPIVEDGGNIARTEDEFKEGLNAGKNVFPFGQKGLKKMTSTPPSGDMEVPINMKGFTDGQQTDEQVMLPGEDVNVDGDTIVETPDLSSMDLNKAFDYANSKKFPIFMWKGNEYKLKRHLKKKQRGGLFSSKVTDHVKLNPGFSPDVK